MQGELQKLEERNCQKMATLENLEERISTLDKGNLLRGIDNYSGAALKNSEPFCFVIKSVLH